MNGYEFATKDETIATSSVAGGDTFPSEGKALDVEELTPEQLGGEIRLLTSQARRMALSYAIQIGYRLKIAHEKVGPHGWADWLKAETEFSAAAASRFEKLYEGYGQDQGSLFGVGNKFPTLEKISVSNALRLLAVPEEEREQVAAELDAEHLSARELEKALAERDEARKKAEAAMEERGFWEGKATEKSLALDKALAERDEAEKAAEKMADDLDKVVEERDIANRRIVELESRPVEVAVERDEEAVRKAAAEAKKAAEEAARTELDKLRAKLQKAQADAQKAQKEAETAARRAVEDAGPYKEEAERAKAEAAELRKKLRAAESGAGEVAMLARQAQVNFTAAMDKVEAMKEAHPDVAEKMLTGMERIAEALTVRIREVRGC